MNTINNWSTTVTIYDPERAQFWNEAIETTTLPVISIIPMLASLPGFNEPQPVYMLDLPAITDNMRGKIANALAQRFNLDPADVLSNLDTHGVPILAAHCLTATSDRRAIAAML